MSFILKQLNEKKIAVISVLLLISSFFIGRPIGYLFIAILLLSGLWKKEFLLVSLFSISTFKNLELFKSFPIDLTVFIFGIIILYISLYLPLRKSINRIGIVGNIIFYQGILVLFSVTYISNADLKWLVSGRFLLFNIPLFILPYIIIQKEKYEFQIKNLIIAIYFISILLIGVAFHNLYFGESKTWFLSAFGESYQQLARHFSLGILFILFCLFSKEKKTRIIKIIYFGLLIIFIVGIVLGQSRGILFAFILIASLLFTKLLFNEYKNKFKLVLSTFFLILLMPIIVYLTTQEATQTGYNIERLFRPFKSPIRLELYTEAIMSFLENPLIGKGAGAFISTHGFAPHNIFLEAAADYGLIGLFIFGLFFVYLTYSSLKLIKNIPMNKSIILIPFFFLIIFIESLISGAIGSYRNLWLFGSLILIIKKRQEERQPLKENSYKVFKTLQ